LGPSLHTRHSESYFSNASYSSLRRETVLALSLGGKMENLFENQQHTKEKLQCNPNMCNTKKINIYDQYFSLITSFVNLNLEEIISFFENIDVYSIEFVVEDSPPEYNFHELNVLTRKNAVVEYLDYQIPVTQLNRDMQVAKRD